MTLVLPYLAIFCIALALGGGVYTALSPDGVFDKKWQSYLFRYENELEYVDTAVPGKWWGWIHLAVLLPWVGAVVFYKSLVLGLLLPVGVMFPLILAAKLKANYLHAFQSQVGPWAQLLASNLGASPSIYEALQSSVGRLSYPIKNETERLVRDLSLGTPLESALLESGLRIKNPVYSAVLSTLQIGGQSGGSLPSVLRELSDNLREMERLDGVVRVKTADGKTQSYVLGVFPFIMAGAMQFHDPTYYLNFTTNSLGMMLLGCAIFLWIGSIAVANKILQVDI